MVVKFIFNFCNFRIITFFLTRLLMLGILFSTVANAVFVAKLLISGILFSTVVNPVFVAKLLISGILLSISVILVLQSVFLTRSLVSGILFSYSDLSVSYLVFKTNPLVSILSTLVTNLLYTSFLATSFFTTSLNLLKSTGTGAHLSISNLSTSVFRLAKLAFSAKLELSTCEILLVSVFVA